MTSSDPRSPEGDVRRSHGAARDPDLPRLDEGRGTGHPGDGWGGSDMAEVIFEGQGGDWWPADKGHGPIFYLVGDCVGAFESYPIAGLPKARAEGLQGAVQYAAVPGDGEWTAEWRIPLAAVCLDPASSEGCCFNIGVYKPRTAGEALTGNDKWAVWVGAESANWKVWNAGWLKLK